MVVCLVFGIRTRRVSGVVKNYFLIIKKCYMVVGSAYMTCHRGQLRLVGWFVAGTEGRYDPWLIPTGIRPLSFGTTSMRIQEPTLRALAAAGSICELVAQRVESGDGWVLLVRVGTMEAPLEKQRGGSRVFRSLDAVAGLVESLGQLDLTVKLRGVGIKQKPVE